MTPKQKIKQIILLVFGLSVAHLGVTFFIQANLGTDPLMSLCRESSAVSHGRQLLTGPTDELT